MPIGVSQSSGTDTNPESGIAAAGGIDRIDEARELRLYRSIFDQIDIGFFVQDLSDLHELLAHLRGQGVSDIKAYASDKPGFADECLDLIKTVDVNDACIRIMGATSKADLIGPTRFRPPVSYRLGALESLFENRPMIRGKTKLQGVDGRDLVVLFNAILDWEETGSKDRVIFSILDVTEQERTQERLLAAQDALAKANRVAIVGTLSASIAHELNQPITALRMDAQAAERWLVRDEPDAEEAVASVRRVITSGNRISEIVQGVRKRVLTGRTNVTTFDLLDLVNEATELLERDLALHRARLVVSSQAENTNVRADSGEIRQVLVNMIINGLQAMVQQRISDEPGLIEVSVSNPDKNGVRVSVRDHGPGIKEEALDRMFDTFFTTKSEGMGMGLSICRSTLQSYGGQIAAYNHPERGAVVEFCLPVSAGSASSL